MWDLPGPGLEPVSPALAGGFSPTVPPGKPHCIFSVENFIEIIVGSYALVRNNRDFPGGPVVKNPPANAGFEPWSRKIPYAVEQLSPCATTTEPVL